MLYTFINNYTFVFHFQHVYQIYQAIKIETFTLLALTCYKPTTNMDAKEYKLLVIAFGRNIK
jgi:hypothetical protein